MSGAHSSVSNVPKSKSKSAADSTEMHACVALNNDRSKSKTKVSESVLLICELCGDHFT